MITLNKNCENGAKYFHFEDGKTLIRIYVKLGQGDYSYCNVTTNKQRNRMTLGIFKILSKYRYILNFIITN